MSATLGDPVLLTTYGRSSSSSRKGKGKEVAPDERPLVFASFSSVPKKDEEQVTLAVQGDGIHVYELGDLHPVSSRTFGPSTSFASGPAVVISTEGETNTRRTFVALHSAQGLKKEEADRVIWTWSEPISGDTSSSNDKTSVQLEHDVAYLVASSELGSVIAVSRMASLTRMDLDLNVQNTWSPRDAGQIKKLFSFPARECRFLPPPTPLEGYAIVIFFEHEKVLFFQIVVFGPEAEIIALDPLSIPLEGGNDVVDISLEPSGSMSVLGSDGTWTSFLLDLNGSSIAISRGPPSLHLKSLSFISQKGANSPSVSIIGLHSSFVLLAGTTPKDIVLLLWDIQYGVLLYSSTLPIPSTLDYSDNISVRLLKGSGSQALLVLSPGPVNPKRNSQLRSSVLLVPYSVPERSTIADAMGKADQGAQWLVSGTSRVAGQQDMDILGKEALLTNLREAIENDRIKEADDIFFKWINERDEKTKPSKFDTAAEANESEPQDVEMIDEEEQRSKVAKKPLPLKSILDHSLVAQILATVLRPGEPPSKHYSPKICRYLVNKHLVSHSMVKGGLLDALFQRNDWETIRECFSYVVDLPENELLRLLHVVTKHTLTPSSAEKDATTLAKSRHLKSWHNIPSVSGFLARVVDYPASQAAWRTAIREQFSDVDDLMSLLSVVDEWLDIFATDDLSIGLGEVALNEHSVHVPDQVKVTKPLRTKGVQLPSLENLLAFIQAILDSSFLALLQNSASHSLLQRIAEKIALLQKDIMDLQSLRGPLEPFARAQRRALAEASYGGKRREEVDWRKRRKQVHEQAALSLGPYQVEELVF